MEINTISAPLTDISQLERLAARQSGGAGSSAPDAIRSEAAMLDFEAVFISSLLKQMRQSVDGEGLFPGDKSDALGGLFDLFMGQHLAQGGGLGIHQLLESTFQSSSPESTTDLESPHHANEPTP